MKLVVQFRRLYDLGYLTLLLHAVALTKYLSQIRKISYRGKQRRYNCKIWNSIQETKKLCSTINFIPFIFKDFFVWFSFHYIINPSIGMKIKHHLCCYHVLNSRKHDWGFLRISHVGKIWEMGISDYSDLAALPIITSSFRHWLLIVRYYSLACLLSPISSSLIKFNYTSLTWSI